MSELMSGVLFAEYAVIALFFLRFWTSSRDRLFALFAAAFSLLALQRIAIASTREIFENQTPFYLLRLTAFVLIIVAIIDKNRR